MHNFRLKLVIASILLFIIVFGVMTNVPAVPREPLGAAMQATGANIEEFSVNTWVKLPMSQLDNTQAEDIVKEVMNQLGLRDQNYQLVHKVKNKLHNVQAEYKSEKMYAVVMVQIVPSVGNQTESEVYLVINIEAKADANLSISEVQEKIIHISDKFGNSSRISTCLIGWLDGKLMDGEWHKRLKNAFMVIDADIIDKLELDNFYSYTGFAPSINDWLQVGNKKINLNMAMRYSPYDNRTYVVIGSPIITREY